MLLLTLICWPALYADDEQRPREGEREREKGREVKRARLANKLRINGDDTDSKAKCRLNWKLAGPNETTRRSRAEK